MPVLNLKSYCTSSVDRYAISATAESRSCLVSFFHMCSARIRRKGSRFFLAFCWISGLMCGVGLCRLVAPSFLSQMRGAWNCPVSIGRQITLTLLPFLFSALAVFASRPGLLYVIAFCKGSSLSFVATLVQLGWGSAGWLACRMICFGSLLSAPLLYFYWLRHIGRHRAFSFREMLPLFFLAGIIGNIHFFIIAPLLARVIHFLER